MKSLINIPVGCVLPARYRMRGSLSGLGFFLTETPHPEQRALLTGTPPPLYADPPLPGQSDIAHDIAYTSLSVNGTLDAHRCREWKPIDPITSPHSPNVLHRAHRPSDPCCPGHLCPIY